MLRIFSDIGAGWLPVSVVVNVPPVLQHVRMDESNLQQGVAMIDLRSPDAALSEYARRYIDLLPEWSPQLQQRMDYMLEPDAPRLLRIKPA